MELIIIGSGTAALQADRNPSGYILRIEGQTILLDGGSGTLIKCLQAGISYKEIDKIFYTHLHPDHTVDLIPFLFATKHTPGFNRTKKLELFGPIGFQKFYDKIVELYGVGLIDVDYEISLVELSQSEILFDKWIVKSNLMKHSENAIGYRFESEGKTFVYSGDTDFCNEIIALAKDANVLLIECSFPDDSKVPGHLTPGEAGKIAALAKVERVILTHIYPAYNNEQVLTNCTKQFTGDVILAEDLMRVKI